MNISEAREMIEKYGIVQYFPSEPIINRDKAEGFIEAYDQQSALIKRLSKALEKVVDYRYQRGDHVHFTEGNMTLKEIRERCHECNAEDVLATIPKELRESEQSEEIPPEHLSEGKGTSESEDRDSEEKNECICYATDYSGYSVCGVPCLVHRTAKELDELIDSEEK